MAFFKLDKLGPRPAVGEPKILNVRVHAGANFDEAFNSAKEIVRTSEIRGVGGFRLTNSAGNSRIWFLGDEDASAA